MMRTNFKRLTIIIIMMKIQDIVTEKVPCMTIMIMIIEFKTYAKTTPYSGNYTNTELQW